MNSMRILKIKVCLQKYRRFILVSGLCLLLLCMAACISETDMHIITADPTKLGVMGTLSGALIGGIMSLMGSVWVNSRQQRAQQNIKRKNIIYSPLYDELVDIHNNILKRNPYPNYIEFKKGPQTILPHPQFTAWGRIKLDTRYLEVPDILKKQMELLENSIYAYMELRHEINDELREILNAALKENGSKPCSIINIGDVISGDILSGARSNIYQRAMGLGEPRPLDRDITDKVNSRIYELAEKNEKVVELKRRYGDWINTQQQTIELLGLLIKSVIQKYEG